MTALRIVSGPAEERADAFACTVSPSGGYADESLLAILRATRTIAMVGASANWNRPSYFAMRYLQRKGYRVIPINPGALGAPILGERVYPDLASVPDRIDVVDVFRRASEAPAVAEAAVAARARVLWLQLGIRSDEARSIAEAGGLTVIEDRCMKIEYGRLGGELGWCGVNTGIITSRRRRRLG